MGAAISLPLGIDQEEVLQNFVSARTLLEVENIQKLKLPDILLLAGCGLDFFVRASSSCCTVLLPEHS
jgi:hypothetical protein